MLFILFRLLNAFPSLNYIYSTYKLREDCTHSLKIGLLKNNYRHLESPYPYGLSEYKMAYNFY